MRYAGNPSRSCLRSPSPPALTARGPSEPPQRRRAAARPRPPPSPRSSPPPPSHGQGRAEPRRSEAEPRSLPAGRAPRARRRPSRGGTRRGGDGGGPASVPVPAPRPQAHARGGRHMAAAAISCPGGPRPAAKMGWGGVYPSIFTFFPDLKYMYRRLFVQPEQFCPSVTLQAFQAAV